MSEPESWDDSLHDAVALVESIRLQDRGGDDFGVLGFKAVTANMNASEVAITLAKLISEILGEQEISPDWFRHWSSLAVRRS